MALIDKMRISGLRSFGPDNPQLLQFNPPVTLILGQNGCGKTTIIEALKFITTGEVPPGCGKGASFIHDPKITGETNVKGQVRLRVVTPKKEQYDFVKRVEVTQKPKTLEFKTLEQTVIFTDVNGQKHSASNKCVDFHQQVVSCLGVSKPILENVIFCHQEESNWPLDEGKKVKDKFDAIFNATKYIKCLDTIRKLRTEKKKDEKNMGEVLVSLKAVKDEADAKAVQLNQQQQVLEKIEEEQNRRVEEKKPIKARILEIDEVERSISELREKLGSKENRVASLEADNVSDAAQQTTKIDCSDAELARQIDAYQSGVIHRQMELDKVEKDIRRVEEELDISHRQLREEEVRKAKLESEQENYMKNIDLRNEKLIDLANSFNIPKLNALPSAQDMTDETAADMLLTINNYVGDQERDLEQRVNEMLEEERNIQLQVDMLRSREAALSQEVKGYDLRVSNLTRQLSECQKEINVLQHDMKHVDLRGLQDTMKHLQNQIDNKRQAFNEQQARDKLDELKCRRTELEREVTEARRQQSEMNAQAATRNTLDVHRQTIADNNKRISAILRRHKDEFEYRLSANVTTTTLKTEFDEKRKQLQSDVEKLRGRIQKLKDSQTNLSTTIEYLRNEEKERENEVKDLESKIFEHCQDLPLEQALAQKKEQLDNIQSETGELESTKTVMFRYIDKLEQEDCCPLCHRDFSQHDENLSLRNELRAKVDSLPDRLKNVKRRKAALEKQYNSMLQLEPLKKQLDAAKKKLRDIKDQLSQSLREQGSVNRNLEDTDEEMSILLDDECQLLKLQGDVMTVHSLNIDILHLEEKCKSLMNTLGDDASHESLASLEERLQSLECNLNKVRDEVEQQQNFIMTSKQELSDLTDKHTSLAKREIETKSKQQIIEKKKEDLERLERDRKEEQVQKQEKSQLLTPARMAVKEQEEIKEKAMSARDGLVKAENMKLDGLRRCLLPIENIQTSIRVYKLGNNDQLLLACRNSVNRHEVQNQKLKQDKMQLDFKKKKLTDEKIKQEAHKVTLDRENRIRRRRVEISSLKDEVKILRAEIDAASHGELMEERTKLVSRYHRIDAAINEDKGRADITSRSIAELQKDLRKATYRDAGTNYRKKMVQKLCTEMACEDLNKYYTALDSAIMRFHKEKMKHINQIIERLWRTTYRGNDIDRIEIKTDEAESRGADKRRTYNYRVVMHKGTTELDMRGRCSAGQKVLASLIIRIALAETFSKSCGILALDEPTTNLDRDNIESLIMALMNIISDRKNQRNFQLILITHDQEFLEGLSRGDQLEDYYRVYRDPTGLSKVSREMVMELNR